MNERNFDRVPCAVKSSSGTGDRSIEFHHSYAKLEGGDYGFAGDSEHDTEVGLSSASTDKVRKKANLRYVHAACSFIMLSMILFIMMWDMKKVQRMSTIIHDDHRSLWVRMNSTVLRYWYNSYDLCLLSSKGSVIYSRSDNQSNGNSMNINTSSNVDLVANQCHSVTSSTIQGSSSKQLTSSPLRCNVGYGYHNLNCLVNLTMRSFYRYMLNDKALGDPRNMMLRSVLMDLSMTKRPVVILGDGVSKQSQDAMICEMLRTDKSVKVSSKASFYSSNYTLRWSKERRQLDLFYFRLVSINAADDDVPHRRRQRRRRRVLNQSIDDSAYVNSSQAVVDVSTIDRSRWVIPSSSNDSSLSNDLSGNSTQSSPGELAWTNISYPIGDEVDRIIDSTQSIQNDSAIPVEDERPLFTTQLVDSEGAANNFIGSSVLTDTIEESMQSNDTIAYNSSDAVVISNDSNATNATLVGYLPNNRVTSVRFAFVQNRVKVLLEQYRSLVVIVNVGVYYNSREQFRTDLPQLLDWMHSLRVDHNCTVFFRETAAQHWSHTSSGYFELDIDGQNSSASSCMPVADSTPGKLRL